MRSIVVLLARDDFEGSVNRAYYAMFHAAGAALASRNVEIRSRKHGTLIRQFSRHLITGGILPKALGRAINEVQKLRQVGDYEAPVLAPGDAEEALVSAQEFVAAIERLVQG